MNWTHLFRPFLAFLLKWLSARFVKLSQMDGRAGLSADDFERVVGQVIEIQSKYKNVDGMARAKAVGAWVYNHFQGEITEYVVPLLVAKAYEYADAKGLLKETGARTFCPPRQPQQMPWPQPQPKPHFPHSTR